MTHARPLTPIEVDTLRVALALLLEMSPANADLLHARAQTDVSAIASDDQIARLWLELEHADVTVRRAGA